MFPQIFCCPRDDVWSLTGQSHDAPLLLGKLSVMCDGVGVVLVEHTGFDTKLGFLEDTQTLELLEGGNPSWLLL